MKIDIANMDKVLTKYTSRRVIEFLLKNFVFLKNVYEFFKFSVLDSISQFAIIQYIMSIASPLYLNQLTGKETNFNNYQN